MFHFYDLTNVSAKRSEVSHLARLPKPGKIWFPWNILSTKISVLLSAINQFHRMAPEPEED